MLLDSSMTIGQRFKIIRTEKGFSQAELTEGICSPAVVSQIECDRKYPSAETLGKLADKLGIPLREIMGMQEKQMEAGFQIEMIRVYVEKGDYSHALELINDMDQKGDLLEHQRVLLLTSRAESLIRKGNCQEAVELLIAFLEQQEIQQTVDDETLCDTYNKLGNAYFYSNDFEKAFSAFEQGYRVSVKLPDFGLIAARVTKNLGLTCNHLGYNEDAGRYLKKAYTFFKSASNINELANTLFYLALATENAEYMERSRLLYEELNFVREANLARQHYAFLVLANTDYKEGLKEIEDCTEAFQKIGDVPRCIYTLSRSALICIKKDRLDEAEYYLDSAEKYMGELTSNNYYQLAEFFIAKATYYFHKSNYEQAILDAKSAAEICVKMGLNIDGSDALRIVAESYHQLGKHEEAYKTSMEIVDLIRKPLRGALKR